MQGKDNNHNFFKSSKHVNIYFINNIYSRIYIYMLWVLISFNPVSTILCSYSDSNIGSKIITRVSKGSKNVITDLSWAPYLLGVDLRECEGSPADLGVGGAAAGPPPGVVVGQHHLQLSTRHTWEQLRLPPPPLHSYSSQEHVVAIVYKPARANRRSRNCKNFSVLSYDFLLPI